MKRFSMIAGVAVTAGALTAGQAAATTPCGAGGTLSSSGATRTCTYAGGAVDTFTVPAGITSVAVLAAGGHGGGGFQGNNYPYTGGGQGATVSSTLSVTSGNTLTIKVAGNGGNGGNYYSNQGGGGGSNGGGSGGGTGILGGAGGGGGESDVLGANNALLVVAGGGGGGGSNQGGGGGGNAGADGTITTPGSGAKGLSGANGGTGGAGLGSGGGTGGGGAASSGGSGGAGGTTGGGGGGGGAGYPLGGGGGGGGGSGYVGGGGGGGASYSTDSNSTYGFDGTATPRVTISWTASAPTVTVDINDAAGGGWLGTEVYGAKAFASSKVDTSLLGYTPTGTVTYKLHDTGSCGGNVLSTQGVGFSNGVPSPSSNTDTLKPGAYSFEADYSGDAVLAAASACKNFSVGKLSQSITFPNTPVTYGQAPYSPATAGSGQAVTYTDVSGACTTADSLTLVITGAGACTATANAPGTDYYAAAPQVTQTFAVTKATVHIDAAPESKAYGEADPAPTGALRSADFVNGDTAGSAGITGAAACMIADHAANTGVYAGAVTCAGGTLAAANYTFATGTAADLTINKATQTITFTSTPPADPRTGGSYTPVATATSGLPVSLSIDASSTAGACALTGSKVNLIGTGTCVIDADQAGDTDYLAAAPKQQTLQVTAAPAGTPSPTPTPTITPTPTVPVKVRLTVAPRKVVARHRVTLTATLAPAPDGGTVVFTDGKRRIRGCTALRAGARVTCRTVLKRGRHAIVAWYSGDAAYGSGASRVISVAVRARH